jgi:four helix bundle protein
MDNPVLEKSFAFALRIVRLSKYLSEEKREYVLSKELLMAGTNIGKHVKEAVSAANRKCLSVSLALHGGRRLRPNTGCNCCCMPS